MSNIFNIKNSRGTVIATVNETERDKTSTSLVLHGRRAQEIGLERDENIVHLLENFASSTPPNNGIEGQLWWKTGDQFYIYHAGLGSPWIQMVATSSGVGFTITFTGGTTTGSPNGFPTGSPLTITLNVGAGTGITVNADSIQTKDSEIVHSALLNYDPN